MSPTPKNIVPTPYPRFRKTLFREQVEAKVEASRGADNIAPAPANLAGPSRMQVQRPSDQVTPNLSGERTDLNELSRSTQVLNDGMTMRGIGRYQKNLEVAIPRLAFQRVVKQVFSEMGSPTVKGFTVSALGALQEAAEEHLISIIEDGNLICIHRQRAMLTPKDILLARKIRGNISY